MTSDVTRRTALGFFTVAGIAAVSGCSNSIFSSTSVKTHTPSSSDSSEPATTSSEASLFGLVYLGFSLIIIFIFVE